MGLIKEGRVRPLAFTGTKPFPLTPDVPLMKDLIPGTSHKGPGTVAPGKTPTPSGKLDAEIRKALQLQAVTNVMQRDGYMPDSVMPPRPPRSSARRFCKRRRR